MTELIVPKKNTEEALFGFFVLAMITSIKLISVIKLVKYSPTIKIAEITSQQSRSDNFVISPILINISGEFELNVNPKRTPINAKAKELLESKLLIQEFIVDNV